MSSEEVSIDFDGIVYEFKMNTRDFTVTPQEFYYVTTSEADVLGWAHALPDILKRELRSIGGGIILWRIKPEIYHAEIGCNSDVDPKLWTDKEKELGKKFFCWQGYARFATSPALSEKVPGMGMREDVYRKKWGQLREEAMAREKSLVEADT